MGFEAVGVIFPADMCVYVCVWGGGGGGGEGECIKAITGLRLRIAYTSYAGVCGLRTPVTLAFADCVHQLRWRLRIAYTSYAGVCGLRTPVTLAFADCVHQLRWRLRIAYTSYAGVCGQQKTKLCGQFRRCTEAG